jgi:hypothetical protein
MVSEPVLSIVMNNITSTTDSIGLQTVPSINNGIFFIPSMITANLGPPLTGSAAMGFTIGMMKG